MPRHVDTKNGMVFLEGGANPGPDIGRAGKAVKKTNRRTRPCAIHMETEIVAGIHIEALGDRQLVTRLTWTPGLSQRLPIRPGAESRCALALCASRLCKDPVLQSQR